MPLPSSPVNSDEEVVVDVTELFRRCASRCLSHSLPFTPPAANDAGLGSSTDGTVPGWLHVRGTSGGRKARDGDVGGGGGATCPGGRRPVPGPAPLDLQDAMTALELGDARMDCCEIPPSPPPPPTGEGGDAGTPPPGQRTVDPSPWATFPPRIAPTSLGDGAGAPRPSLTLTPANDVAESATPSGALLVPAPPCPPLLPNWDALRLTSSETSPSPLVTLMVLQLVALEAYIGADNGGSSAAETLYCATWLHDGVLADMAVRLGADPSNLSDLVGSLEEDGESAGDEVDELFAARWTLFASSLGAVRIAEAVRCAVVNADFYEEEDFGVTLHGGKGTAPRSGEKGEEGESASDKNKCKVASYSTDVSDEERTEEDCPSSMRFCPALQGSQLVEVVWDTAISRLRRYRSSYLAEGGVDIERLNPTIDALETVLLLQQSFFQAIKTLSNLNDETVRDFTKVAKRRVKECVRLLEELRDNEVVAELSREGLVGPDGRLLDTVRNQPGSEILSASFDPFVNRRLLGNAPVRRARFRPPADALSSLARAAAELEWGVCDPILHGDSLGRIARMLQGNGLRGCGGPVPSPSWPKGEEGADEAPIGMNILSRSLLILNLYFDDKLFGQYDFGDMIGQHMKQQCAVPELLIQDGAWTTRIAKPMYDTLKSLCLNRHRERRFIESVLFPAFQLLQYEAANVDEKFRQEHGLDPCTTPPYATNYVILNTIRLMERYVGLGIELGLYPNWYDLSTALWYRDFLLSALINVRGSIDRERVQRREMDLRIQMEQEEEERKVAQQGKKKGKMKKGKKNTKRPISPTPATPAFTTEAVKRTTEDFEDRLDYTALLLHRYLCRGLVRYIAALRQAKLLPDPPASISMFTTQKKRFEKRFETFSTLYQPPSLSYDDYLRGSDFSAVKNEDLIASAADCFRSGKGTVDWLLNVVVAENSDETTIDGTAEKCKDDDLYISIRREEIMALAKVCVTNSLFLHKLASMTVGGKNLGKPSVSIEFKAHKQYCTMSIT